MDQWIDRWQTMQDVGLNTEENREYLIRRFIRPYWGTRPLNSITGEEITGWERKLPDAEHVSRTTAKSARGLLHTILGDAAAARPPLIPFNPVVRPRNRGRRTGRSLDRTPPRVWATPLEVLLVAERAALLGGRDEEFTMLVTIGYTGMRWGETIGLEHSLLLPGHINVEWQLSETKGRFHRQAPKDDDYRTTNREPWLPVDLPPFLSALLITQASKHTQRCVCAARHDGSGRYVFLGPDGGHHRRSNYARRIFRPACDGQYPAANGKLGKLVLADATTWPGTPVAAWPPAVPEEPFSPPSGRGTTRLVSADGHRTLPIMRILDHPAARRSHRRPQGRRRAMSRYRAASRRGRSPGQLAAGQARADAARPSAQPQNLDDRGRHAGDSGRATAGPPGPRDARPLLPRLTADAGHADRGSPGPLGTIPRRPRRTEPALAGPAPRRPAGASPRQAVSLTSGPGRGNGAVGRGEPDLPDFSQHGYSSHPQGRIRAVQRASDLVFP